MYTLPQQYSDLAPRERRAVRIQYIAEQKNMCMYCNTSLDQAPEQTKKIDWGLFPKGFMNNPIHLQHDHNTGWTEGAVHAYCNAVLWQYEGR